MNTSRKWITALVFATAMSLTSVASGAASIANDAPAKRVKVWDLDLASSADVQTLYERVQKAANDVCRDEAQRYRRDTRRPAPLGWRERCVDDAVNEAIDEVGNRRLAALHTRDASRLL